MSSNPTNIHNQKLPIGHNEDVEFSEEIADEEDRIALARAEAADQRVEEDVNNA